MPRNVSLPYAWLSSSSVENRNRDALVAAGEERHLVVDRAGAGAPAALEAELPARPAARAAIPQRCSGTIVRSSSRA